jgi:hypothetical protein
MSKVTVYYFLRYDIGAAKERRSQRPATMEAIKRWKVSPLRGTAREVEPSQIDSSGYLKVRAGDRVSHSQ